MRDRRRLYDALSLVLGLEDLVNAQAVARRGAARAAEVLST